MEASSGRNPEIEVLRGVAVMLVILNHVEVLLPWHHGLGWDFGGGLWCGVDLFFCISGYVIARSLLPRLRGASGEAFWREAGAFSGRSVSTSPMRLPIFGMLRSSATRARTT
jgi:peptidoglycan/LPS O-acetylase OafA/YrhL